MCHVAPVHCPLTLSLLSNMPDERLKGDPTKPQEWAPYHVLLSLIWKAWIVRVKCVGLSKSPRASLWVEKDPVMYCLRWPSREHSPHMETNRIGPLCPQCSWQTWSPPVCTMEESRIRKHSLPAAVGELFSLISPVRKGGGEKPRAPSQTRAELKAACSS